MPRRVLREYLEHGRRRCEPGVQDVRRDAPVPAGEVAKSAPIPSNEAPPWAQPSGINRQTRSGWRAAIPGGTAGSRFFSRIARTWSRDTNCATVSQ
jgi:hypothetical protein